MLLVLSLSAFLIWFMGLMAIGVDWFLMWQSEMWNSQQAVRRIYMSILVVMILVMQRDDELGTRGI